MKQNGECSFRQYEGHLLESTGILHWCSANRIYEIKYLDFVIDANVMILIVFIKKASKFLKAFCWM